jgi:23S rRNA (cytosine1962-C5)-methyltransferase
MPEPAAHVARKRSRAQHAWVFSNEVVRVDGEPAVGDTVRVYERGRLVGSGMYNPHSLIRIRVYSAGNEELDRDFIRRRIEASWQLRRNLLPEEDDFRLLYGESDGVPGLVIDKYGSHYVVQAYAAGVDRRLTETVEALASLFEVASVFEKDDFRLREPEGLERRERLLFGRPEGRVVIGENGARFYVDIGGGQKSGYYFDHRLTRRRVRTLARDRSVLDVFCYTGSFTVNAALGGATRVLSVDVASGACEVGKANAQLNGVADRCEFVAADAFEYLAALLRRGERFELINLDPPAFIKAQKEKSGGLKGYRAINSLAMRLLAPGGVLVSSSCSHYLFWQDLLDVLVTAAQDAGRSFTILDRTTQGPDHPVLLAMPESEYLRGFILRLN